MSLLCMLGRHKPSLASIALRSGGGHKCLCEACAMPLERDGKGKWREMLPLCLQVTPGTANDRSGR